MLASTFVEAAPLLAPGAALVFLPKLRPLLILLTSVPELPPFDPVPAVPGTSPPEAGAPGPGFLSSPALASVPDLPKEKVGGAAAVEVGACVEVDEGSALDEGVASFCAPDGALSAAGGLKLPNEKPPVPLLAAPPAVPVAGAGAEDVAVLVAGFPSS